MNRDWNDFKALHSNIAGARQAFEDACETLYRKRNPGEHVSQVSLRQGDGGIDVFIGELGIKPISVIQCKFFLESFGNSQKAQIRESFETAVNSTSFELKEWILCIPRVIDITENSWWFKWKHKQLKKFKKEDNFIRIINGNELIDLLKQDDLYNQVFQMDDSNRIKEMHDVIVSKKVVPKKVESKKKIKTSTILFNNYSKRNEPFYLLRDSDSEFNEALAINNIWLFGKSGFGKTSLISRNLIQNSIDYCFCDLSPIRIKKAEDVLLEILVTIEEKFSMERDINEENILKQISKILCLKSTSRAVIVIDELSVSDDKVLRKIAEYFIQLVTHFSNQSEEDELRFVVSTIANPKQIIRSKSKASEHFHFICCNSWESYSSQLFDILSASLNIDITESKSKIIEKSQHSPRILKNIFRKIVVSRRTNAESVDKAIIETLEEIVE